MAPILGHHKAFIVILEMLGWERQNKRHYRQTVEEINHYTSVSDCPCTQHFAKTRQKDPISKKEGDN